MTNDDSILKNKSGQKNAKSCSGGIIACVVMMQHVKAVAVAVLACSNGCFVSMLLLCYFCTIVVM